MQVTIEPERGCAISHLTHRESGVDILWWQPRAAPWTDRGPLGPASGVAFNEHIFSGGWFPMFPFAGSPGDREDIRQHGEAAWVDWTILKRDEQRMVASVTLAESTFLLDRTIEVIDERVLVRTRAVNTGEQSIEIAAGEHPCFPIEIVEGWRLDTETQSSIFVASTGDERIVRSASGFAQVDFSVSRLSACLRWDRTKLPGVMTWQDGRTTFAIEPKTYVGRVPEDVDSRWVRVAPAESWEWKMSLEVIQRPR